MKTRHYLTVSALAGASVLLTTTATAATKNSNHAGRDAAPENSSAHSGADKQRVRVTRASNYLGSDVMASDGRKVGDIVDYYFDTASTPHLKYVIVATGGFLGYGGDTRAVPADALETDGDSVHLRLDSDDYWNLAVLPQDRDRYLANPENKQRLAQAFQTADNNRNQRDASDRSDNGQSEHTLVSFTDLQNADVYDKDGQRLGRFVDTWMSLDNNRAPFVEISSPPASPFQVRPRHRFAIPIKDLQADDRTGEYRIDYTADQVRDSELVSETDGVKMLQDGQVGDAVLRVQLAQL